MPNERATHYPLLLHGDCVDVLSTLLSGTVDVVICDPPAGIGFMSKPWDSYRGYKPRTGPGRDIKGRLDGLLADWSVGFVVFMIDVWTEVDRVLKPGGFVCAWALPKTADLAGLAMRAVGWTIHESLLHLFGSGMNKAGDIGKQIDKAAGAEREVVGPGQYNARRPRPTAETNCPGAEYGFGAGHTITAPATDDAKRWTGWHSQIAPGHEQWLVARKPTRLTYAQQLVEHGCGAFNVDACRVPRGEADRDRATASVTQGTGLGRGTCYGDGEARDYSMSPSGSHPRNVLLSTGGDGCPARGLDRQGGVTTSAGGSRGEGSMWGLGAVDEPQGHDDSGGASRYFTRFDQRVGYFPKASDRSVPGRSDITNKHPTHKHPDLMRWLVKLMAATAEHTGGRPAVVLDPFMGSGTTGVACIAEGVSFIGIERDPVSVRIIRSVGPDGCTAQTPDGCDRGTGREIIANIWEPPQVALCQMCIQFGCAELPEDPMSFYVAEARIAGATGSPEAAKAANETAPAGAQLGLL